MGISGSQAVENHGSEDVRAKRDLGEKIISPLHWVNKKAETQRHTCTTLEARALLNTPRSREDVYFYRNNQRRIKPCPFHTTSEVLQMLLENDPQCSCTWKTCPPILRENL